MPLTCRCVSLFCLQLINQGSSNCLQHPFLPLCFCCWDVSADPSSPPGYHYWPSEELIPCLESLPILLVHSQMSLPETQFWSVTHRSSVVPTLSSLLFQGLRESACPHTTSCVILSEDYWTTSCTLNISCRPPFSSLCPVTLRGSC